MPKHDLMRAMAGRHLPPRRTGGIRTQFDRPFQRGAAVLRQHPSRDLRGPISDNPAPL
jgi:hypothetical protein